MAMEWSAQAAGLVEASPDAIVGIDVEGRIVLVNAQAELLFGHDRRAMVGRPVEMLVPEGSRLVHPEHRRSYLGDPHPRAWPLVKRDTDLRNEFCQRVRTETQQIPETEKPRREPSKAHQNGRGSSRRDRPTPTPRYQPDPLAITVLTIKSDPSKASEPAVCRTNPEDLARPNGSEGPLDNLIPFPRSSN